METIKEIKITKKIREQLMAEFPVSEKTLFNAVKFATGGYAAEQIRLRAQELGGVLMQSVTTEVADVDKVQRADDCKYPEAANYLRQRIADSNKTTPDIAIILGSGLGRLADMIEQPLVIPYGDIPHFKTSTAVGHKGNLIIGSFGGRCIMAMQGRFHYYEGYTMQEVSFPVRVFAALGIKTLMVSNAAGAVNPNYRVGDLMVIDDHINFMPNPLVGPNDDNLGPRFPDMTEAYSRRLRLLADREASAMGITLRHGVYAAGTGPTYETPAEYRMYRMMGADACGMSTVPEVIVARHAGIEVFGMSVITNQSNDLKDGLLNDADDVVHQADAAAERMTELFRRIVSNA